jgi:hypothetical protein
MQAALQNKEIRMWWKSFLWGFWNGMTAWLIFTVHLFGKWKEYPLYDTNRRGGWYDFGFLIGVGSLFGSSARGRMKPPAKAQPALNSKQS